MEKGQECPQNWGVSHNDANLSGASESPAVSHGPTHNVLGLTDCIVVLQVLVTVVYSTH